jgi:hypothetical protein
MNHSAKDGSVYEDPPSPGRLSALLALAGLAKAHTVIEPRGDAPR